MTAKEIEEAKQWIVHPDNCLKSLPEAFAEYADIKAKKAWEAAFKHGSDVENDLYFHHEKGYDREVKELTYEQWKESKLNKEQ